MKILIVTQKVDKNDDLLGFFHAWIKEFAKHCDRVTVICLQKGEYDLLANVRVVSLGKENSVSRLMYIFNFYHSIWCERKNYDAVFVHMNREYVVLGGLFWRIMGKKTALWHTHKTVDKKLRIAEKFVQCIFTASKESFRLKSEKVHVVGHGIDTEYFLPCEKKEQKKSFSVFSIGRISPTKGYETLIGAAEILKQKNFLFCVKIIGAPGTISDTVYYKKIQETVQKKGLSDYVKFLGPIEHQKILPYLQEADVFINMSETGSLDKAVLEAFACEVPVLTSNEAFAPDLEIHGLMFRAGSSRELAEKIIHLANNPYKNEIVRALRAKVVKSHNLEHLIVSMLQWLS